MKTLFIFLLLAGTAQAGIAEDVQRFWYEECNKVDKQGVSFCTDRKTGKTYWMKNGEKYSVRPKK